MQITRSDYRGIPLIAVEGDVDQLSAPDLQTAIDAGFDEVGSALILDLSACPFVDSSGLSVLFKTLRRINPPAWLGVVGASANILRVFEIVGLASSSGFLVLRGLSDAVAPDSGVGCGGQGCRGDLSERGPAAYRFPPDRRD